MSVDGEVRRLKSEADEPGWEVDPDDDWGVAVVVRVELPPWHVRPSLLKDSPSPANKGRNREPLLAYKKK
nr:hypothetical protein [Streptomyces europaeiscabiei]